MYSFSCHIALLNQETGFGRCPETFTVHLPIVTSATVVYVPWLQYQDTSALQLHYKSLTIPPTMKFDQNNTAALDKTYQFLHNRLSQRLTDIKSNIDQITEASTSTLHDALTYAAFAMAFLNFAALSLVYYLLRDLLRHKNSHPPVLPSH